MRRKRKVGRKRRGEKGKDREERRKSRGDERGSGEEGLEGRGEEGGGRGNGRREERSEEGDKRVWKQRFPCSLGLPAFILFLAPPWIITELHSRIE